jgi:subtilisin family serine protease
MAFGRAAGVAASLDAATNSASQPVVSFVTSPEVGGPGTMTVPRMPIRLIPEVAAAAGATADGEPWGIAAVGADKSRFDGAGVCVAVLDTGIDVSHPAFEGLIHGSNYRDFTGTGLADTIGHGTHCAGIIFGRDIGGKRIGIARGVANVLIGKIADRDALTTTDQLYDALVWAVGAGAQVISLSIGLDFIGHAKALMADDMPQDAALGLALSDYYSYGRFFDRLMSMMIDAGTAGNSALVVAAGGNESHADGNPAYRVNATLPAVANGVLSVGALARGENGHFSVAPFSNEGVSICAPGVAILSARPGGGTATMTGTSQAAPHVAGVAALWAQKLREETGAAPTPASISGHLIGRADRSVIFPKVPVSEMGEGLVAAP